MSKTTQLILNDEQLNIAVQDIATQQAWDMRSLELTIETLRTENARLKAENTVLRDALNWALKAGGWELWYYGWDMPETIRGGSIGNHAEIDEEALERAVAAIIEGEEVTS